jgi:CheY-like chemotaxis protein/anti-sigma regulatory factor (Ser/Thr protein kinase)
MASAVNTIPLEESGPLDILVVDDDESTRKMLALAISRKGHAVDEASGGESAIKLLRDKRFDIVVSDIHMDDIDGISLMEIARGIRPDIGIILVTGFQTDESVLDAFRKGASGYLRKPIKLQMLYRTLDQVAETLREVPKEKIRVDYGAIPANIAEMLSIEADDEGWISFEAPSHRAFIDRFANVCELLLQRGLDTDITDEVRVAILELGANAVEWGNRLDASQALRFSARLLSDRLIIVVEDQGEGFVPESVPNPAENARAVQKQRMAAGKRPGGYGIALVRAISDHLFYNESGNTVAMVKLLKARPSAG